MFLKISLQIHQVGGLSKLVLLHYSPVAPKSISLVFLAIDYV